MRRDSEIKAFASNLGTMKGFLEMEEIMLVLGGGKMMYDAHNNEVPSREYSVGVISPQPEDLSRKVWRTYENAIGLRGKERDWYGARFTDPEQLDHSKPYHPSLQFASRQWDAGKEPVDLCGLYGRGRVRALENMLEVG